MNGHGSGSTNTTGLKKGKKEHAGQKTKGNDKTGNKNPREAKLNSAGRKNALGKKSNTSQIRELAGGQLDLILNLLENLVLAQTRTQIQLLNRETTIRRLASRR